MKFLVSILAAAGLMHAAPIYTLADLGTLGGSSAMGTSVNIFGQSAGTLTTVGGFTNAFAFYGSGATNLTSGSSSIAGQANAINDAGQIAGTQQIGNQQYATVWTNGVATTVGGAGSYGLAINNSGEVGGMLINNGMGNAFVSQNGTVVDLGTFDGGYWSSVYGLNDAGQAAGSGITSNGTFRGFIWTPGIGYSVLGTLGGANSYAMAINSSGMAVGTAQVSSGYTHAFESNGTFMKDVGTLGGMSSYAYGINDLGNVVGYSLTSNWAQDGFLDENGVMYDMNALLIDAPGWTITALYGINDSNQVVGVGVLNGIQHAVLLTDPPAAPGIVTTDVITSSTPEPSAWILSLGGLSALLLWKRFR